MTQPTRDKVGWVYILASRPNGILYVGVSSDLPRRIAQHRAGDIPGFTTKYGVKMLVYFERHDDILAAIAREKAIKEWKRAWKVQLILRDNPGWDDLYDRIV